MNRFQAALTGGSIATLAVLIAAPAAFPRVQQLAQASAAVVDEVIACRQRPDGERLACYDAAVDKLIHARTAGDVVVVDRDQIKEAKRQAFGFEIPAFGFLDRGAKPETVERITAKIDQAGRTPEGRWLITLEGGAVWEQTDDEAVDQPPRQGSTVEIRKAALQSYFMKIDNQRSIRVKRRN